MWGAAKSEPESIIKLRKDVDPSGTFLQLACIGFIDRLRNRERGLGTNRCGNMEPEGILGGRGGKFGSCLIGYKELENAD